MMISSCHNVIPTNHIIPIQLNSSMLGLLNIPQHRPPYKESSLFIIFNQKNSPYPLSIRRSRVDHLIKELLRKYIDERREGVCWAGRKTIIVNKNPD